MSQAASQLISRVEYLTFERDGDVRHEWIGGVLFATTGSSSRHNRIAGRLLACLLPAADRDGCRAYVADMKVVTETVGYYPDVMVVCDPDMPGEYHEERPCLIVEVLSPSTHDRDRREKRAVYQAMPSVLHLLLIRQDDTQIEHYFRAPGEPWSHIQLGPDDTIDLACPNVSVPVAELYKGIDLSSGQLL
jgi:Uma2 family endonuclease